ncbi:amino acid permease [Arthrobacter sp. GCM10027362]|uniref:amino acid permease n=1 Tax=Arthrobacter sp. GCM10027362 TaxID=3273379 RepID=UPI003637F3AF
MSHPTSAQNTPCPAEQPVSGAVPADQGFVERGDHGYRKTMSNFQIQMISLGGAIGTGLFLGLGSRLNAAGPALLLAYAATGAVAYLLMRAIGELVMHRPTTGSFVSWAREFFGDRLAHLTGWTMVILGSLLGVVEVAAVSVYVQYWWPAVPAWIPALVAWLLIVGSNLYSARMFGFIEAGASSIKVAAILLFIGAGLLLVFLGGPMGLPTEAGVANLFRGGFFTNGVLVVALVSQGVVFSYSGIEISAVAAGEARNAREVMPKAIRSIVFRILVFYIGSVLVLSMLLPTSAYSGDESPFVTALSAFNIPWLGSVMNFVVLTAALSGVNATLYATVRALRTLAANGDAPRTANKMSKRGVPVGALAAIGGFYFLGVLMTAFFGGVQVFEVALGASAVCILVLWITIFACQLRLRRHQDTGKLPVVGFRMPGAPLTSWIGIAALGAVFVSMVVPGTGDGWWMSLLGSVALFGGITIGYEVLKRTKARRLPVAADG